MSNRLTTVLSPSRRQTSGLEDAIGRATGWLMDRQHADGHWVGELEGDTILESEYLLLLAWLGRTQTPIFQECAEYIRLQQLPQGGWSLYPGGPVEISASVKAYWVLKMAGDDPQSEPMLRAKNAIRAHGGAERVNSFTRYYMALLGLISYQQCPAVPPEIMLLPRWCPLNIYEMSSWSRTILVPLSLLWAFQPQRLLPTEHGIDELFLTSPAELSIVMPESQQLDAMTKKSWVPWDRVFRGLDYCWKLAENCRLKPFRKRAVKLAENWILERCQNSDGLGAIFPPIIWTVVALRCLGYPEEAPEVKAALQELEKLTIRDTSTGATRLQPCKSPVWDTALSVNALRDAGVPAHHPRLKQAVSWLVSKEVRSRGDWSVNHPDVEPAGWFFEFHNEFYPDVDDTIMVTMALARCLPAASIKECAATLLQSEAGYPKCPEPAVLLSGKTRLPEQAVAEIENQQATLAAIRRGVRWTLSMQSRNGGWGAFDADNDREILTRVPFADHNAMIDPPTADITARVLEMFGRLGFRSHSPRFEKALEFIWREQSETKAWYGRWGVNYLYGTWQVLVGLREFGVPAGDARMVAAAGWLKSKQQSCGGWGETPASYDDPQLQGVGPVTPSQTAWAILGLIAAGDANSEAVSKGIQYLLDTQTDDGSWEEPWFTGTGFPRVFYLRYHYYRHYFPLMALGRYAAQTTTQ